MLGGQKYGGLCVASLVFVASFLGGVVILLGVGSCCFTGFHVFPMFSLFCGFMVLKYGVNFMSTMSTLFHTDSTVLH